MFSRLVIALIAVSVLLRAASPDSKLIDLNVVAVDSNQQPVTDLTLDEFRITDEGRNQPIAFFRHMTGNPPPQPPPARGEYTNGGRANARHLTVILLDMLNQRVATESLAADMIVRHLSSLEDPDDLYLYALALDGKLVPIHGLDGTEAGSQNDKPWTSQIKPLMDGAMRSMRTARPGDTSLVNVRIDLTFRAMQGLADQLAAYPGWKNLVWITDGLPAAVRASRTQNGQTMDFRASLRQLGEHFAAADVAIYPVRQFMMGSSDSVNGDLSSIEGLNILTGLSGGRPDAGNDIGAAVQQAVRDLRSDYQLGYYPPDDNWDGKLHNLRVTCTRKGVRVQVRESYLASNEPAGTRADRATAGILKSHAEAAEIGLRAQLTPDPSAAHQTDMALRIAADDVVLAQDGDRYIGQLRVTIVFYRKDGSALGLAVVPLKLSYDATQREKTLRDGIEVNRSFSLDGVALIRAVAFDFGSGLTGSLAVPVAAEVPQ
jgi:VWFA-related protein